MTDLLLIWIKEGIFHILDPEAFDHLLYIIALSLPFILSKSRELLIQVTAFTLGHTAALVLAATAILSIDKFYIELGILLSIIFTAVISMLYRDRTPSKLHYLITLFVGCIHGLGFGSYFAMMHQQRGVEFISSLVGFNVGVEVGQLVVIAVTYLLVYGLVRVGILHRWLLYTINTGIVIYTTYLLYLLISG